MKGAEELKWVEEFRSKLSHRDRQTSTVTGKLLNTGNTVSKLTTDFNQPLNPACVTVSTHTVLCERHKAGIQACHSQTAYYRGPAHKDAVRARPRKTWSPERRTGGRWSNQLSSCFSYRWHGSTWSPMVSLYGFLTAKECEAISPYWKMMTSAWVRLKTWKWRSGFVLHLRESEALLIQKCPNLKHTLSGLDEN